jgi:hypothetical protein
MMQILGADGEAPIMSGEAESNFINQEFDGEVGAPSPTSRPHCPIALYKYPLGASSSLA